MSARVLRLGLPIAVGRLGILFAPWVAAGFTSEPAVRGSLAAMMVLFALLMIPDGGRGAADAVLRARGENLFPAAIRVVAFVPLAPAIALWLVRLQPGRVVGVFEAILIVSWAAFVAMLLRLAMRDAAPAAPAVNAPRAP